MVEPNIFTGLCECVIIFIELYNSTGNMERIAVCSDKQILCASFERFNMII